VRVPPPDFVRSGDDVLHRLLNAASTDSTMGLFPICMNVVQFWLIDSIVKAGGSAGITLPVDPADREPLFRSSSDSSDDNSDDNDADGDVIATPAKHDIEAQGLAKKHRQSDDSSHTYPPSLNGSPPSASSVHRTSSSPPPASRSVLSARRQRPPPLQPRSLIVPTLNPPDPSSQVNVGAGAAAPPKEDWQTWDGDDDWVERLGEEEWTGRRAEATKNEVDGVWRDDAS
jgi:STIMATE family